MDSLSGRAVLVVDDDADALELYASALAKLGAEVRRAKTVDMALGLMTDWRPDVVLCDLHLPGRDGYSLLESMRADALLRDVPVIAISGSHPSIERERSLRAGFTEHFAKPTKLRELVEALVSFTSANKAAAQPSP